MHLYIRGCLLFPSFTNVLMDKWTRWFSCLVGLSESENKTMFENSISTLKTKVHKGTLVCYFPLSFFSFEFVSLNFPMKLGSVPSVSKDVAQRLKEILDFLQMMAENLLLKIVCIHICEHCVHVSSGQCQ